MLLRFTAARPILSYHSTEVEQLRDGDEVDLPDDVAKRLLADFPKNFAEVKPRKVKPAATGGPKKQTKPAKGKEK